MQEGFFESDVNKVKSLVSEWALLILYCAASAACAQEKFPLVGDYPNKPVRMISGTSPGSGSDVIARLVAQRLTERWSQPVVVENRAGAAGIVALEILSQATSNGYTIGTVATSHMTSWMTQRNKPFNFPAYSPIVQLTSQPYFLVVPVSLPPNSVKELIAYAKSKPGELNYASAGRGSTAYLGMELFKAMAGVDMVHVSYAATSQAVIDVAGGRIQAMLSSVLSSMSLVKQGKVKVLAVSGAKRVQGMGEVPTISEAGVPGYEVDNMYGVFGPAGMPKPIVAALNRQISQIMNAPETKTKLAADGSETAASNSPDQFRDKLISQFDRWGKIILNPASNRANRNSIREP